MDAHFDDFDMTNDLRDLSQAYRSATKHEDDQGPSPKLDAAILAAAHRAVASRPQAVPVQRPRPQAVPAQRPRPQAVPAQRPSRFVLWRQPLAIAASFFLIGVLVGVLGVLFAPGKTNPDKRVILPPPSVEPTVTDPPTSVVELPSQTPEIFIQPAAVDTSIHEKPASFPESSDAKLPDVMEETVLMAEKAPRAASDKKNVKDAENVKR